MTDVKKPKIVDIKKKPKVTQVKEELKENEDESADEFGDLIENIPVGPADAPRDELRKKQLEDITPVNPEEELRKVKKKRFGLF